MNIHCQSGIVTGTSRRREEAPAISDSDRGRYGSYIDKYGGFSRRLLIY